jgi:hypothetical protein
MTQNPFLLAGQALVYAGFAAVIGWLSQAPAYHPIPEGHAQIKLSFAHGGKPKGGCRKRSAEELAALAPNMRKVLDCPRERVPVVVMFNLDGQDVYEDSLEPTGVRKDGASRTYRKFIVSAGEHRLRFKLRDSERSEGFDYTAERVVVLVPGQNLAVDFDAEGGGFQFR